MKQSTANDLYTRGNNEGRGYAPYTDATPDDSVAEAVNAAQQDGWEVVLNSGNASDVVVLALGPELMAIGGDAHGHAARAVAISAIDAEDADE